MWYDQTIVIQDEKFENLTNTTKGFVMIIFFTTLFKEHFYKEGRLTKIFQQDLE